MLITKVCGVWKFESRMPLRTGSCHGRTNGDGLGLGKSFALRVALGQKDTCHSSLSVSLTFRRRSWVIIPWRKVGMWNQPSQGVHMAPTGADFRVEMVRSCLLVTTKGSHVETFLDISEYRQGFFHTL